MTYGHDFAWAVLVALMVVGAWVRHYFNLRHTGRNAWAIPATAAAAIAGIAVWIAPPGANDAPAAPPPAGALEAGGTGPCPPRGAGREQSDPTSMRRGRRPTSSSRESRAARFPYPLTRAHFRTRRSRR